MSKIRNKLIKLLGGLTVEDHKKWLEWKYINGQTFAYERLISIIKYIRELPSEEQYDLLYKFVLDATSESYKHLPFAGSNLKN